MYRWRYSVIDGHTSKTPLTRDEVQRMRYYCPKQYSDEDVKREHRVHAGERFNNLAEYKITVKDGTKQSATPPLKIIADAQFHPTVERNMQETNITELTPTQQYTIPIVRAGCDMLVCSPTGTGKSGAYIFPIVSDMLTNFVRREKDLAKAPQPFAVIVVPTRELAIQTMINIRRYLIGSDYVVGLAYGQTYYPYQSWLMNVKGCDILVATPGRLHHIGLLKHIMHEENDFIPPFGGFEIIKRWDLFHWSDWHALDFSKCRYIVLDEIDVFTESCFMSDISYILEKLYKSTANVQTLMFTATLPNNAAWKEFQSFLRKRYTTLTAGVACCPNQDVQQEIQEFQSDYERRQLLIDILKREYVDDVPGEKKVYRKKTIVFFNNAELAEDSNETGRTNLMKKFKNGEYPILLSTFVASRGLDIEGVAHVINYELPDTIKEYVHRIGRSGRAGNIGKATSLANMRSVDDRNFIKRLIKANVLFPVPEWLEKTLKEDEKWG